MIILCILLQTSFLRVTRKTKKKKLKRYFLGLYMYKIRNWIFLNSKQNFDFDFDFDRLRIHVLSGEYPKVLVPDLLLDKGTLEHDEHHESEDRVVPVLIQAPQSNTEHLQNRYDMIRDGPNIGII